MRRFLQVVVFAIYRLLCIVASALIGLVALIAAFVRLVAQPMVVLRGEPSKAIHEVV
jgi:hypothetical protein